MFWTSRRVASAAVPRTRARRLSWLLALVVAVSALGGCQLPSGGDASAAGVPVLGQSRLTAAQLVAYYNSRNHLPYRAAGVTIEQLAQMFVDEGNRYNVRGDIAFAQSILETAWFNYPDCDGCLLTPTTYNYAGIGACDACANGFQFSSPLAGVRAQMQLLRNMADPGASIGSIPDPPVPELWGFNPASAAWAFDHYFFKGKAQLWNDMPGVWASSSAYATSVVTIYNGMLLFNDAGSQCPADGLAFGGAPAPGPPCPPDLRQPGRAVARDAADGYYILNGNGAVRAIGAPYYGAPAFDTDWARDIAVMPGGGGYVVLSGDGHVYKYGSAASPDTLGDLGAPDWPATDLARAIVITPDGRGYLILDAHGTVWKYGSAADPNGPLSSLGFPSWPDGDNARSIDVMPDGAGYVVLDVTGGVWKYGSATQGAVGASSTPWLGWADRARDVDIVDFMGWALGYLVLDGEGNVWSAGFAPVVTNLKATPGADRWRSITFHANHPLLLKNDGAVVTAR